MWQGLEKDSLLAKFAIIYHMGQLSQHPLQRPYDGPFPVLDRHDKYFRIALPGHNDTVSIDRLKPAYLDASSTSSAPLPARPASLAYDVPPPHTTRSGRRVRFPDYF